MNLLDKILYVIPRIHIFIKLFYCNYRYNKKGFRKYAFTLYEKKSKENGGGFNNVTTIIVKGWDSEFKVKEPKEGTPPMIYYTPSEDAFLTLRDEHKSIFIETDHLTYKEII